MVSWAVSVLRERLSAAGYGLREGDDEPGHGSANVELAVTVTVRPSGPAPARDWDEAASELESFEIETASVPGGWTVDVVAFGPRGAMYGVWEVVDRIEPSGALRSAANGRRSPRVRFRAVKFDLPWASYRRGPAMALHDETCRSRRFWREYIDMLARNRFNVLTLWSLHPFPWMVRVAGFEYATPFSDLELAEWRELWKFIFRHAKDRGLDTYIVTWNIFVSDEFALRHGVDFSDGEYHFGAGDTRDIVKEYNRRCISALIDEYEDLTGVGTGLGERMENLDPLQRQRWVDEVVVAAVKAAKRAVKFILRAPFTADPQLARDSLAAANLDRTVWMEYKFNWSHGHSTPTLCMTHDTGAGPEGAPTVDDRYWNPPPESYRLAWMVRNEDFFVLRWGSADFIRSHVRSNAAPSSCGYFVGSEGMIPAKDLSHRRPHRHLTWEYAFQKQWLFYALWGNLLYDPGAADQMFADMFARRYGPAAAGRMLEAFARASVMPLRFASFYRATWDYTLYSEGFLAPFGPKALRSDGSATPFVTLDRLMAQPTLDPAYVSIAEYADSILTGRPGRSGISPLALARSCAADGARVASLVAEVRREELADPDTCDSELDDLLAWSHLLLYFGEKIEAGVALALYRGRGSEADKREALGHILRAEEHWNGVCKATDSRYGSLPYIERGETGYRLTFSWSDYRGEVHRDVDLVRESRPPEDPR